MNTVTEIEDVHQFILETLEGVVPMDSWGETAFFYNPNNILKRGTYFATIKEKDGENDKGSNLNREGAWRLNIGVRKTTFLEMFNATPARPAKGCIIEGPWDFNLPDQLMPHPVYGWMAWMAIVNPSPDSFEKCKPLIVDAHQRAVEGFKKRTKA